jgi:hypothetical protein
VKTHNVKSLITDRPRRVPVHPTPAGILGDWLNQGFRRILGPDPKADDLPIPSREGNKRNVNHAQRKFHEDLDRLKLRRRRQHDARRTLISHALADGARKDVLRLRAALRVALACLLLTAVPVAASGCPSAGPASPSPEVSRDVSAGVVATAGVATDGGRKARRVQPPVTRRLGPWCTTPQVADTIASYSNEAVVGEPSTRGAPPPSALVQCANWLPTEAPALRDQPDLTSDMRRFLTEEPVLPRLHRLARTVVLDVPGSMSHLARGEPLRCCYTFVSRVVRYRWHPPRPPRDLRDPRE